MTGDLKNSVNEHLESVSLDENRLRELEILQQRSTVRRGWHPRALAIAMATFTIAAVATVILPWRMPPPTGDAPAYAIADEAVINHLKQRPLEVQGDSLHALSGYFDDLGFRLVDTRLPSLSAELLGGRYCSVQGIAAAQLRQRDPTGRTQTLYQVPYDAGRFGPIPDIERGEKPRTLMVRGLSVDLWVERGLLFVLTRGS